MNAPRPSDAKRPTHSVYVIRLRRAPNQKPWVYVGSTGLTPDARFDAHKRGHQSNDAVKRYGVELMNEFTQSNLTWDEAQKIEVRTAQQLRAKGFDVIERAG